MCYNKALINYYNNYSNNKNNNFLMFKFSYLLTLSMMEPLSHENNFNLVVGRFNGLSRLSTSSYSGALAREARAAEHHR